MRQQVEERLHFFETGEPPSKNADAIRKVLDQLALDDDDDEEEDVKMHESTSKKDKKKRKAEEGDEEDEEPRKKVKLSK